MVKVCTLQGERGGETCELMIRFAVANVDEDTIKALGPRLLAMNRLMGMEEAS